ncbi:MAG: hypothetical protein M3Z26_05490 [Bacteroidota bacterium]|nr:hypothetical protein [Bacteroidota bacterium]
MKKIITLLLFVGACATSFAQYGHDNDNHDHDQYSNSGGWHDNRGDGDHGYYSERDRDFQIAKINRDFNFQVQSIENDPFMRHHAKKVAIRNAEYQRDRQTQMVNARFSGHFHSDHDRHDGDRW